MKVKRVTTADQVQKLVSRDEPEFPVSMMPLEKIEITNALNWYSQNKSKEDSHKYLASYCKANNIKVTQELIAYQVSTLGFVCRLLTRGAHLDTQSLKWLHTRLNTMDSFAASVKETMEPVFVAPAIPKPVVNIQDRLKAQANKCMGDLEGAVDEYILSDFKKLPNTLEVLREHEMKGPHGPSIVNTFKKNRDELRVVLEGADAELAKGYDNFTWPQLKKLETLYAQIVDDTLTIMGESQAAKTPRAKKAKSPEQQVKNLKFCAQDTELKITSVSPLKMIGSEGVWLYNRKNRMVSYYAADDVNGLGIKGSAILNFSKAQSWTKKLRKPEEMIEKIVTGGKVTLKNLKDNLTTKEGKLNGRMGSEVLLLRVII